MNQSLFGNAFRVNILFVILLFGSVATAKPPANGSAPRTSNRYRKPTLIHSPPEQRTIVVIRGEGIGPFVTEATQKVMTAAARPFGLHLNFLEMPAGAAAIEQYGASVPEHTLDAIREHRWALKGPLETPIGTKPDGTGYKSPTVDLRARLFLTIGYRPAKTIPYTRVLEKGVDVMTFRVNVRGRYGAVETRLENGDVSSTTIYRHQDMFDVMKTALTFAYSHRRKKVDMITKANQSQMGEGLYLTAGIDAVKDFVARNPGVRIDYHHADYKKGIDEAPTTFVADDVDPLDPSLHVIEYHHDSIVDAQGMQLHMPGQHKNFDVVVAENLLMDIRSDDYVGKTGGPGVGYGINLSMPDANGDVIGVAEPVHGIGSGLIQKGTPQLANPMATMFSGGLLFATDPRYVPIQKHLERAMLKALRNPANRPMGMKMPKGWSGPPITADDYANAVILHL